ncbi:BamA/TamA family outer membrane protein [bacterium]|nr:BamA/TamA family outer membrane protein [bacterium]MCB2202309.1 BamA/TamA family outer membrane protein [bacterium]
MTLVRRHCGLAVALALVLILVCSAQAETADSTDVRVPQPKSKSAGEVLLDIPSFIISIPVYIIKTLVRGFVALGTDESFVAQIVELFSQPLSPVTPAFSYEGNSSLAGGLAFRQWNLFDSGDRLRIKGLYSLNDYSTADLKYSNPGMADSLMGLTLQVSYQRMPRETFFGLGNHSEEADEVAYALERTRVRGDLMLRAGSVASVGVFGGYTDCITFDGEDPDLPGRLSEIRDMFDLTASDTRSAQFVTIGGSLESDTRNSKGQPSSGGRNYVEVSYNTGVGSDDDIRFTQIRAELSQYFELYRKRIIAFRAIVQNIDNAESAGSNPFYLRSSLGGPETLRGYRTVRLTDNDLALVTIEYRYPIYDMIDALVFFDEGRVFSDMGDEFTLKDWRYSAGIGLRVWNPEEVVVSAQVARSDDGWEFFFQAGQGF